MFLIISLMLSQLGFAQNENICVIGTPLHMEYVDSFRNPILKTTDSFLKHYRFQKKKESIQQRINNVLTSSYISSIYKTSPVIENSNFYVSKDAVACSIQRTDFVHAPKKLCKHSYSDILEPRNEEFYTYETPCITQDIIDYIHWSFNETLKCFSKELDQFEKEIIFKKINLESSFGFFFQSKNGTGITQVIPKDIKEMLHPDHSGFRFLRQHVGMNRNQCSSFKDLLNKDFLINTEGQIPHCQFISLGEGLGRALISGVGLYIYYRSHHTLSAENLLKSLGVFPTKNIYYKKMRAFLTLGMYNKGPGTVRDALKVYFEPNELAQIYKRNPKLAYNKMKNKLEPASFYTYVAELEALHLRTFNSNKQCSVKSPRKNNISKSF